MSIMDIGHRLAEAGEFWQQAIQAEDDEEASRLLENAKLIVLQMANDIRQNG